MESIIKSSTKELKIGDRVTVVDPDYCCADVGTIGTIVDIYNTRNGILGYRIRWDGSSSLFNARPDVFIRNKTGCMQVAYP